MFFEEPLQHNPIGTYVPSSGWRFLIFNNLALLDMPGEYVCVDLGDGQGGNSVDILDLSWQFFELAERTLKYFLRILLSYFLTGF